MGLGRETCCPFLWRLPVHAFQRRASHVWIHVLCTFKSSQKIVISFSMFLQFCNLIEFFCMLLGVQSCTYWVPACCRERRPEFPCPKGYCTEQDAWGLNFSFSFYVFKFCQSMSLTTSPRWYCLNAIVPAWGRGRSTLLNFQLLWTRRTLERSCHLFRFCLWENFYVNAVSEDRAAQVSKVHGTTIKAGQQGCRFNSQEMEKHSRNTMYPKSQQHPIYQLAYGGGHKEERKHTELGNLWWTGTCLETGQAIGTVGTCGEQVTSPASKRRPYRSWLVRLFQWHHLAGVQLQQHAMKVKSIPLKNFENIFTWYVH